MLVRQRRLSAKVGGSDGWFPPPWGAAVGEEPGDAVGMGATTFLYSSSRIDTKLFRIVDIDRSIPFVVANFW